MKILDWLVDQAPSWLLYGFFTINASISIACFWWLVWYGASR